MLTSYAILYWGCPIHIRRIRLSNFRNYVSLDLCLDRGVTLIDGRNGHGKTNLLEAIYLMVVGRSSRGATDRQLVRAGAFEDFLVHAQVSGDVIASSGRVNLQIDFSGGSRNPDPSAGGMQSQSQRVQKTFRMNGVPKRSSDFVGILKAVLFAAEDIDLLAGPPSARRRYVDVLAAQLVSGYVREAQEYQKVLTQRNHLLKSVREREAKESELEFWDVQLSIHAARMMVARLRVLRDLDKAANHIHDELSGLDEELSLSYMPSLEMGDYENARDLSMTILRELQAIRRREIGAGFCLIGPHRDDFSAELNGMEVGSFASRGQTRTVILAMKLGEAQLIDAITGENPVVLLDDVMSELDLGRRKHVFNRIRDYDQVVITTAEADLTDLIGAAAVRRMSIDSGRVTSIN